MKTIQTICFLLFLGFNLNSQAIVNNEYLPELNNLEKEYVKENKDPKGIEYINYYNSTYELLSKALNEKGLTLDFNNFDKKQLKIHPELKLPFKNFKKALKTKANYFYTKEDFKELIEKTYPKSVKKIK